MYHHPQTLDHFPLPHLSSCPFWSQSTVAIVTTTAPLSMVDVVGRSPAPFPLHDCYCRPLTHSLPSSLVGRRLRLPLPSPIDWLALIHLSHVAWGRERWDEISWICEVKIPTIKQAARPTHAHRANERARPGQILLMLRLGWQVSPRTGMAQPTNIYIHAVPRPIYTGRPLRGEWSNKVNPMITYL